MLCKRCLRNVANDITVIGTNECSQLFFTQLIYRHSNSLHIGKLHNFTKPNKLSGLSVREKTTSSYDKPLRPHLNIPDISQRQHIIENIIDKVGHVSVYMVSHQNPCNISVSRAGSREGEYTVCNHVHYAIITHTKQQLPWPTCVIILPGTLWCHWHALIYVFVVRPLIHIV